MSTDQVCQNVSFTIQGHPFCTDFRILAVQGYDVILGVDWLASLGDIRLNLRKGVFLVEYEGKEVKLLNEKKNSELHLSEGLINVDKEHLNGNQVYLAHLYKLDEEE